MVLHGYFRSTASWRSRWFAARAGGRMPTMNHAGVYSETLDYPRAAAAAGSAEPSRRRIPHHLTDTAGVAAPLRSPDTESTLPDATRLLILFYSRSGSTEALARAAAEGAREGGATVRLRRAREVVDESVMAKSKGWLEEARRQNALYEAPSTEDADWADAILFGTPSYFGAMATELKAFLDQLGPQWKKGAMAGKVAGAMATASWPHGGTEVVTLSLYAPMAHLGMVIVPTGYTDEAMLEAGSPYGASAIVGAENRPPRPEDLDAAHHQGRRMVAIAGALVAAGEMPNRKE